MNKEKTSIFIPILWFITAGVWFAAFGVDLYYGNSPDGLVALRFVCAVASLAAAISNLIRYRKSKDKS